MIWSSPSKFCLAIVCLIFSWVLSWEGSTLANDRDCLTALKDLTNSQIEVHVGIVQRASRSSVSSAISTLVNEYGILHKGALPAAIREMLVLEDSRKQDIASKNDEIEALINYFRRIFSKDGKVLELLRLTVSVSLRNAPQVSQNLGALNLILRNEKEPKPVTMMALKLIAGAAVFDLASQKIMSLKDAIHPTTKMGKLVNKIKNFIKPREVARLQELETGVARIYMKLARLSSDYGVDLANVDLPTAERHTVGQQFSLADIATLIENKESYTLLELVTAGQNQHENALRESRVIEKKIRRALENMNAVFLGQLNTDGRNGIITFPPALKRKVETEADNAKSHLANASTLISQIKKELHGIDKILDALKMQDELGDFKSAVMDRLYGLGIEYKALLAKFEPIILKRTEQMTTLLGYSNVLAANSGQYASEELVKNLKSILGTTNLTRSGNEF